MFFMIEVMLRENGAQERADDRVFDLRRQPAYRESVSGVALKLEADRIWV